MKKVSYDDLVLENVKLKQQLSSYRGLQKTLLESQELNQLLVANSFDLIIYQNLDGIITFISPQVEAVTGYHSADFLGEMMPINYIHPDDVECFGQIQNAKFDGGVEYRFKKITGEYAWFKHNARFLVVEDEVKGVVNIIKDISNEKNELQLRKKMSRELVDAQTLMQAAFNHSPIPMLAVTYPDYTLKIINKAAEDFLLIDATDYLAKKPYEIEAVWPGFLPDGSTISIEEFLRPFEMQGVPPVNLEMFIERKDGKKLWQLASGTSIYAENGALIAGLLTLNDITSLKEADQYRNLGTAALEILNQPDDAIVLVNKVLLMVQESLKCDAVGLRLQEGNDFPYLFQYGFSSDFLLTENSLIAPVESGQITKSLDGKYQLECTCGLVLSDNPEAPCPLMTSRGSFWTNDSFSLLSLSAEEDPRVRPRNRCIHEGYGSLAFIPIKIMGKIVGLMQLNAYSKDVFSNEAIHALENIAMHIGESLLRKNVQNELILSKEKAEENEFFLKESQKSAKIGSYVANFVNDIWRSSEGLDDIFGINEHQEKNIALWMNLIHSQDREMMIEYLNQEVIAKRSIFNKEYRIISFKDGECKWVLGFGTPTFDEDGNILSLIGTIQDITDRKLSELAYLESEEKYKNMVEILPDGVLIHKNGVIEFANSLALSILNAQREEVLGHSILDFIHPDYKEKVEERIRQSLSMQGAIGEIEEVLVAKTGETVCVNSSSVAFTDRGEKAVLVVFTDITNRKIAERELIAAKEQAEESDRLKSAFLANMSHEIRTPMNGILGFAGLLKEPNLSGGEQHEYVEIIEKSGKRMLNIINDLIDISKIEAGQMDVSLSNTNINEQLSFLFNFFRSEAKNKGIHLVLKCPLGFHQAITFTDREKLYAVLTNLIKNALKFTPKGDVDFGYELKDDWFQFYVKDSGKGIPLEKQEAVFDRFVQAETGLSRGYEGAGLGLSISKAYVEMLGGKIWVESSPSAGSCFLFTIPRKVVSDSTQEEFEKTEGVVNPVKSRIEDFLILLAEDDEVSSVFISRILKLHNLKFINAKTGVEAVELCRTNSEIKLVLMDIKMPQMDGYTATKKIKEFRPDLPIIAQTAYALKSERSKYGDVFDDYINKPIDVNELKEKIETVMSR